ncbi:hypothetical protein [Metabacillus fastidiosus]|uniref:hypothetical protein n=1 Tax=Metabacillus fastidiosus TaxID=1458 RepID=UPI003D2C9D51
MEETKEFEGNEELVAIQKYINYIIAILLLTGQLTITGVFVKSDGISISLGGPIIGSDRTVAKRGNRTVNLLIEVIDVILALLIFTDQIGISSIVISSEKFFINVTGPIFSEPRVVVSAPAVRENIKAFNQIVPKQYQIDSSKMGKIMKGGTP